MVAILVLLTIITFLTIDYLVQRAELRRAAVAGAPVAGARAAPRARAEDRLLVDPGAVPAGVFLSPGHTWVSLQPEGSVRVGADRLPGTLLGRVERVDVLAPGTEVRRGQPIATLVRGDREVELPSPLDGRITGVNAAAAEDPGRLTADPFGGGWLYRLAPAGLAAGLKGLAVAEEARTWMAGELRRLRDFLAGVGNHGRPALATLPDGGLPADGVADDLTDDEWRDLATAFFRIPEGPGRAPAETW